MTTIANVSVPNGDEGKEKKSNSLFRSEKWKEIAFLASFYVVLFLAIRSLFSFFFAEFGVSSFQKYNDLYSLGFWFLSVGKTLPYFLVSVPEVTALITVNLFGGELKEYQTGINFRFPWEQVKAGNYINLRIITQDFEKGESYPALDGVMLDIKWSFQYRGMKGNIKKYITVDETVIESGLHNIGSSFLAQIIANLTAETARQNIKRIEQCMKAHYEHEEPLDLRLETTPETREEREKAILGKIDVYLDGLKGKPRGKASFEEQYGIDLILIAISDVDYEDKFQKALSSREVARKVKETARVLQEKSGASVGEALSDKDAMDAAMVINKDVVRTVQHNIQEIKGEGMEAVANFLTSLFPKK